MSRADGSLGQYILRLFASDDPNTREEREWYGDVPKGRSRQTGTERLCLPQMSLSGHPFDLAPF
jgi:hypothetical protein